MEGSICSVLNFKDVFMDDKKVYNRFYMLNPSIIHLNSTGIRWNYWGKLVYIIITNFK